MAGVFEGLAKTMAAVVSDVPTYQPPQWANPQVWIAAGVLIVLITLLSIYFRYVDVER
jgi:hypothetical protein